MNSVTSGRATQKMSDFYARSSEILPGGRLNERPARIVIDALNQQKFTGRLVLSHREKRKKLWFYQGEIFRIQSNLAPELFGQMMIERDWLNEEDLKRCLHLQRDSKIPKTLGDLVKELYAVDSKKLEHLSSQQKIRSLFQALTWTEGEYEFSPLDLKVAENPAISYRDFVLSIQVLLSASPAKLGRLFDKTAVWKAKSGAVNLAEFPIWSIFAGCRLAGLSGILSIRKQNKLHEVVIKHGIPLTLYEGTFGQPRQTIVVRQASEEHERFFVDQLFKLFSFLTGSAHFRILGDAEGASSESSREKSEGTAIVSASRDFGELTSQLLIPKKGLLERVNKLFQGLFRNR